LDKFTLLNLQMWFLSTYNITVVVGYSCF